MGLDLIHAPILCQAVYLGNHLVHLIGHDPVVTLIDNPAANLIGEGHAWYKKYVSRILLHGRCKQFHHIHLFCSFAFCFIPGTGLLRPTQAYELSISYSSLAYTYHDFIS